MEYDLSDILVQVKRGDMSVGDAFDKILSLIGENDSGVSDASATHGDLPLVRECNASDKEDESNEVSEHGTLEKITDSERVCKCSNTIGVCLHLRPNGYCLLNKFQAYPKES